MPGIIWGNVAQSLGIEFPRKRSNSKLLDCVRDYLGARVVHLQGRVIILVNENLQRLEKTENGFLTNFATAADSIFLRAHIQQRVMDQIFPAHKDARCLRSADILTAADGQKVETKRRILPEPRDRRNVRRKILEAVNVVFLGDGDSLRTADPPPIGQNIGKLDVHGLGINSSYHLFACLNLD